MIYCHYMNRAGETLMKETCNLLSECHPIDNWSKCRVFIFEKVKDKIIGRCCIYEWRGDTLLMSSIRRVVITGNYNIDDIV